MDAFRRGFPAEALIAWDGGNPRNAVRALFAHWVLPGEAAGTHGLRLAIRDNRLNLYVKGQSVAELRMVRGAPQLRLHQKYWQGVSRQGDPMEHPGPRYHRIDSDELASLDAAVVRHWIAAAEAYALDEKRFVDDLVTVTPGVIDLEMGLPADRSADRVDRAAPRMDLVVVQPGGEIAFWEAKCAVNGELRSSRPYREVDGRYVQGPHVLWQLRNYQRWMGFEGRACEVANGYRRAASILLTLARHFGRSGTALDGWEALAATEAPRLILPPGLVIADYCPSTIDGAPRPEQCRYDAAARSAAPHLVRLRGHGATVAVVSVKPTAPVLPMLTTGEIAAQPPLA